MPVHQNINGTERNIREYRYLVDGVERRSRFHVGLVDGVERVWFNGFREPIIQIFDDSGTSEKPSGATRCIVYGLHGGGGGGGQYAGSGNPSPFGIGSGGGGGGSYKVEFDADTLPDSCAVVIGAGGGGGPPSTSSGGTRYGGNGGTTTFNGYTTDIGSGGRGGASGQPINAGGASGGSDGQGGYRGGNAAPRTDVNYSIHGNGGGAAGTTGDATVSIAGPNSLGGDGALRDQIATNPGAGGGGSRFKFNAPRNLRGKAGAKGRMRVEWHFD